MWVLYLYWSLQKHYHHVARDNTLLKEELNALDLYKDREKTLLLQNQLMNHYEDSSIYTTMEQLGIPFTKEEEILCILLHNEGGQYIPSLKSALSLYLLDTLLFSNDFCGFILRGRSLDGKEIKSIISSCLQKSLPLENCDITCYIGRSVSSCCTFYQAYESAYHLFTDSIPDSENGFQCFVYKEVQKEAESLPYPYSLEQELKKEIKNQNLSSSKQLIIDYFDEIDVNSYSVLYDGFYQLFIMLRRIEGEKKLNSPSMVQNNSFCCQKKTKLTKEDMLTLLFHRLEEDIAASLSVQVNHGSKKKIADKILKFIHKNTDNPNLNVDMVADNLGMSKNYLRTVCKEVTEQTLTLHLQLAKINQACKLLVETDDTVYNISEQLDFISSNYFYTFFKKHTGMTPLQYRLINREKQSNVI